MAHFWDIVYIGTGLIPYAEDQLFMYFLKKTHAREICSDLVHKNNIIKGLTNPLGSNGNDLSRN